MADLEQTTPGVALLLLLLSFHMFSRFSAGPSLLLLLPLPPSGEAPGQVMDGVMIQFLAEIHRFSSSFTPSSFNPPPPPPSGFLFPHSGLLTHICWLAERAGMFTRVISRIPLAPSSVFVFLSSPVENQSRSKTGGEVYIGSGYC